MVAKLHARGQDPMDNGVPSSFAWRTFKEIPNHLKYNMDEVGSDTNKGRKKVVGGRKCMTNSLRHMFEMTDGDNNPFHATFCMTTRSDGQLCIPPMLGHSNPSSKSKTSHPKVTHKQSIC